MLDFYVKTGIRFSLRDKWLFEITEVEITSVDCMKKKITINYPKSATMGFFPGTQERVRNSRGKRAISVRAIEVLLYHLNSKAVVKCCSMILSKVFKNILLQVSYVYVYLF